MTAPSRNRRASILFAVLAVALGFIAALAILELGLRLLPVRDSLDTQRVDETQPYMHFKPNRELNFSTGWNFQVVNKVRVNNFGFVNGQDYNAELRTPLLAIIGDSYVEALMVPYPETIHGRLATLTGQRGRVYSFGASGSSLSQYLAYAKYARDTFGPRAMVFVVVGNDFDESLVEYKSAGGFHYLSRDASGNLKMRLEPFEPSFLHTLLRRSALARYLNYNLSVASLRYRAGGPREYVGNVSANVDTQRIAKSKQVIEYFLQVLPTYSGLEPAWTVIVVDGIRPHLYSEESLKAAQSSYFAQMRSQLLGRGRELGYVMVDMQPHFLERHARDNVRFEWPFDGHWNAVGHEEAALALLSTGLPERLFGSLRQIH